VGTCQELAVIAIAIWFWLVPNPGPRTQTQQDTPRPRAQCPLHGVTQGPGAPEGGVLVLARLSLSLSLSGLSAQCLVPLGSEFPGPRCVVCGVLLVCWCWC
jgi:hypothetical protein